MIRKNQLPEPVLSDIALQVLEKRYLKKDEEGVPTETPRDMFWRVARTIAAEEEKYGMSEDKREKLAVEFYEMMAGGYWLPNSPTLMNAGRPLGQLSACFVLPVEDSLSNGKDGIYDTLTSMALIHQSGGGTGFSFSRLRPSGSIVRSTTGVASGPVSFMRLYDASTDVVKQGGTRRGANMGILRVDHPDVEKFIDCKTDTTQITNFNISVAITNEFMEKVLDGDEESTRIWDKLCHNAWSTGEPGLFFIDEANKHNPVPHLGDYEATNPCGEQPLLAYDVCNLGSLNLSRFVQLDMDDEWGINWDEMTQYIYLSVRFLDNVIDANNYPLEEIESLAKRIRRIGTGVMGWADMLLKLGIKYDSRAALDLADEVANFFVETCVEASMGLANERGAYPEWIETENPDEARNCNVTTVAPTGTISIIAGCSGGIEPVFAYEMKRRQADLEVIDRHPDYEAWLRSHPLEDLPDYFVTTEDVSAEMHVRMQAAWQKHVCSAISKTINLPKEASVEDVDKAYRLAYNLNCKGVTVYRDGSRPLQVLSKVEKNDGLRPENSDGGVKRSPENDSQPLGRPEILSGRTRGIASPIGKMYVTVNEYDGRPYEVFVAVGKAGGTSGSFSEAVGRLISLALRKGIDIKEIHRQLRGISSDRAFGFGSGKVASGPDAVAKVLEDLDYIQDMQHKSSEDDAEFAACPDCHAELTFEEGCYKCHACGYGGC